MAWRIHDSVQRGEVDNRERGSVRGRLWLHGLAEPVVLELRGNAGPDLAGCLLAFENPGATIPLRPDAHFNLLQRGTIGDLTASRKVRVPDVPMDEFIRRRQQGLPALEHWANCLYLEWFSEANGRVVVESHDYKLAISPPAWRLTPEEEQQRRAEAEAGFQGFVEQLDEALAAARHEPPEDKEWDEFDYEKLMRESDARTDKYAELFDKYREHPDRDRLIAKEMGWTWLEEVLEEDERGSRQGSAADSEQEDAAEAGEHTGEDEEDPFALEVPDDLPQLEPDPATEGVDWVRDEDGDISHPLARRAFDGSMALWHQCDDLGLGKMDDDDLAALLSQYQITGAKLAGALNGLAYGRDAQEGAFVVACLKRALNYLHAAQAALEKVGPKNLLPAETIASTRAELFAVREAILQLMEEFRGQK
ncbi:MAG: hypothetical protein AAB466_05910 [Verrucomicrobiota bacterium]